MDATYNGEQKKSIQKFNRTRSKKEAARNTYVWTVY